MVDSSGALKTLYVSDFGLHKSDLRLVAVGRGASSYLHMKDSRHLCHGQVNHFQQDGFSTLAALVVA